MDMYSHEKHAHLYGKSSHLLIKTKLLCPDQGLNTQTTCIMYPYIPTPAPVAQETCSHLGWIQFCFLFSIVNFFLCAPYFAVPWVKSSYSMHTGQQATANWLWSSGDRISWEDLYQLLNCLNTQFLPMSFIIRWASSRIYPKKTDLSKSSIF